MTIIRVRCIDQVLTFESTPTITSGGLGEDFVNFQFCSKWDGTAKTAVFWRTPEEAYHAVLDLDGTCAVPHEVLADEGVFYFGVYGVYSDGRRRTSEVQRYLIGKGVITESTEPSDPTPDMYTQLLARYAEALEELARAEAVAVEAASAAKAAQQAAESAGAAAGSIASVAANAESKAAAAQTAASDAVKAANTASSTASTAKTVVDNHAADKNNPHGVTCEQIGAATSGHTHTAADVGATRVYTSLDGIGLTIGSETIESIMAALPDYSDLRLHLTSKYNATEYPATNGTLIVQKYGSNRAVFQLTRPGQSWFGLHLNGTWGGWKQVATTDYAVNKAGDTMSGPLKLLEGSTIGGYTPIHTGNAAALGFGGVTTGTYTGTENKELTLTVPTGTKMLVIAGGTATSDFSNATVILPCVLYPGQTAVSAVAMTDDYPTNGGTPDIEYFIMAVSFSGTSCTITGAAHNNALNFNHYAYKWFAFT